MKRACNPRLTASGMTLLELLVVVAVFAIAVSMAIPAWGVARRKQALETASESITQALITARWMAMTSGQYRSVDLGDPERLRIRDLAGNVLLSRDLGPYSVTLGSDLPSESPSFDFDSRGFVFPSLSVPITLTASGGATRILVISPLGKIARH